MKTVLLVAADRREFQGLCRHVSRLVRLQWPVDYSYWAESRGQRLLMIANGPGRELVAEALAAAERREDFEAVVSTGFCGALNPTFQPGDIFVASKVKPVEEDTEHLAELPETSHDYRAGTLVTTDHVVDTSAEKRRFSTSADAVDMEASAVAEKAVQWRLPFYCVRAVSDGAAEDFACDINGARREDGRFSGWQLLAGAMRQPGVQLPELWRLWRQSRRAANTLGVFLAACRF